MRSLLSWFIIPVLCLLSADGRAQVSVSYEFEIAGELPSTQPNTVYFAQSVPPSNVQESSVFSVASGVLAQNTTGFNGAKEYILGHPMAGALAGGGFDSTLPLTVEARLRVIATTGPFAVTLDVRDGAHRRGISIGAGGLLINFGAASVAVPGLDISAFHVYTISSAGNSDQMTVHIDDTLVFSGQALASTENGAQWGDVSSVFSVGHGAQAEWDYVRIVNTRPLAVGPASWSGVKELYRDLAR
jgi:hypothetical protein